MAGFQKYSKMLNVVLKISTERLDKSKDREVESFKQLEVEADFEGDILDHDSKSRGSSD